MNEKLQQLVDLKVALALAEQKYEAETDDATLTALEEEITNLQGQITALEDEIKAEEVPVEDETEEVVEDVVEEEVEEASDEVEEKADESQEEQVEEVVQDEEEVTEEVAEEDEEEVTEEDVTRSKDWVKVNPENLTKIASYGEERGGKNMDTKFVEQRAKDLKEGRTVLVGSSNVLLEKHESDNLATVPFKQFSSLVDLVKVINLPGGESYEAPFTISYGVAGNTEEGADYATAEPTFGSVEINKVKITAYAEISEELEKLPAADYVAEVEKGIDMAIKKKLAQEIITGDATSNHFVGIFCKDAANKCVLEADDLAVAEINGDTLTEIIFNYGGDEEVEGVATLMLNKADLLAFSKVRNATNGLREYTIDYANQTINGIPYVINSNIPALATAAEGNYVMAYGVPSHYEMPVFSDIETRKSYDYQFKSGKIAFRASLFTGGNTSSYRGFIRVKKGTATV